jgi:hypothetical protein
MKNEFTENISPSQNFKLIWVGCKNQDCLKYMVGDSEAKIFQYLYLISPNFVFNIPKFFI